MDKIIEDMRKSPDAIKHGVALVRCAEHSERYKDMCQLMRMVVDLKMAKNEDLDSEERNLLSVGYKNLVGAGRGSHRSINNRMDDDSKNTDLKTGYLDVISKETTAICKEVLKVLEDQLIPKAKDLQAGGGEEAIQSLIFYLKMAGDYYRYLAELNKKDGYETKAKELYLEGTDLSEKNLPPTDPIRLGLALNLSVCYYEILNNRKEACRIAKEAFDQAISKLDKLAEVQYKDATLIMQLLRDNLTLWTTSDNQDEDMTPVDAE
mmetsp:Transcript_32188/g.59946  ORF Transcript_32188/g.59946 Transcript_32188/m.59946 type:complete len:264 (-) Transcript_32188:415-1206(-)|eukprot:CAMPEP_0170177760 /NCGR_PEP_ID=MMETSP0040_2-20121228/10992_1 /TAXON_ID=641309 /ORGANISM="Lotharella oceanica, Strain CCMP622" /LENGTH=263 /DNA_ID=CAMNT_0010420537 /DNA_START=81 /DNA_END=872 /DNA_ORIENTATION=-